MADELTDMVAALRARAVEIRQGGKHLRVEKDGKLIGTLPSSKGGEYRGLTNQKLAFERAGLLPKERQNTGSKRGKGPQVWVSKYDGPMYPAGRRPKPGPRKPDWTEADG